MSSQNFSAPFSRAVVNAMRRLYPEDLADKSWDNTGLLLEAPFDPSRRQRNSVLLTVDLTKAVADEAIERRDSVVIAYHPIIFRGLKSLTSNDTQQQSLLRLAAAGITVYSPHTAVDAAPSGLNDWLADVLTGTPTLPTAPSKPSTPSAAPPEDPFTTSSAPQSRPTFLLRHHPSTSTHVPTLSNTPIKHTRVPIKPIPSPPHPNGAGIGRLIRFEKPQALTTLIQHISAGLGSPKAFPIAIPQNAALEDLTIRSAAICAGSGGSVFSSVNDVDLLFTGEMSHHETLAAIERGQVVVALFHSNTERGFLHAVLRGQLEGAVEEEWAKIRKEGGEGLEDAFGDEEVSVEVSEVDRDPYGILVNQDQGQDE